MPFAQGKIQTAVGTGQRGYAGDGGPADMALLSEPFMCAFDSQGNLYVAEPTVAGRPSGQASTALGGAFAARPISPQRIVEPPT
jgi:hypothetical protein